MSKATRKPAPPAGTLILDGDEYEAPAALVEAVLAGWTAKLAADAARAELDEANAAIVAAMSNHGPGAVVVPGVCRCTYVHRQAVKIDDAERLERVLGERYADLVKTAVSHKANDRLLEMAADGDEPLQPAIAACLSIAESDAVTWRAEK